MLYEDYSDTTGTGDLVSKFLDYSDEVEKPGSGYPYIRYIGSSAIITCLYEILFLTQFIPGNSLFFKDISVSCLMLIFRLLKF